MRGKEEHHSNDTTNIADFNLTPKISTNVKLLAGGGCFSCGGPHFQNKCPVWLKTSAGKSWSVSQVPRKKNAKVARILDSDTESNASL